MKLGTPEAMKQEPHDQHIFEEREAAREAAEEEAETERFTAMHDARVEYDAEKERREREEYQAECPHDEHDHGICLDCGLDIMDDLIGRAEMMRDANEDR
jgi:hypothetical protein